MSQTTPRFPVDPAQREALKAALLARHAQRYPARTARAHPWLPRLAMAAALGALLLGSFAAPAEHEVELGRRITLFMKGEVPPPEPKLFRPLLQQLANQRGAAPVEVQVKAQRTPARLSLQVELWGAALAPDAAGRLRAGIPGLEDATITDQPLRGRARTRLLPMLGRRLLGLTDDPAELAAARAELQADLAARGQQGDVDIRVERGEDGRKRVEVEVKSTKTELRESPALPKAK